MTLQRRKWGQFFTTGAYNIETLHVILSDELSAYVPRLQRDTPVVQHKICVMHPKPSTFMTSLHTVPPHCMHRATRKEGHWVHIRSVPKPRFPYCMKL